MNNFWGFLKEFFGFATQERDPEVIRKSKLREIDVQIKALEEWRDKLMSTPVTPQNEKSLGADLGNVFGHIAKLRQERKSYER